MVRRRRAGGAQRLSSDDISKKRNGWHAPRKVGCEHSRHNQPAHDRRSHRPLPKKRYTMVESWQIKREVQRAQ
jgi:hypothetical protein